MSRPACCNHCGATEDLRLFAGGMRCPACTPAALAGVPEPGRTAYCPPRVCWCGTCPHAAAPAPAVPAHTAIDDRHITSGKRSANRGQLVAARTNRTQQPA
jgi:hypothetical protein